jgi:flavorubredoxin
VELDYDRPIELNDGIYWVGFSDVETGLHCNPYLIIAGDEVVLIDGGSRPDFSKVMMKILAAGVNPNRISTLIYQHYDPDLCGSIPNLEDIIGRDDLRIVSHRENNIFISHYSVKSKLLCVETMGFKLTLRNGRTLRFFKTPYSHSAGSFVTMDVATGTMFTSDLFGAYGSGHDWKLFGEISAKCFGCDNSAQRNVREGSSYFCPQVGEQCIMPGIFNFHRRVMTSTKAFRHAVKIVLSNNPLMVAPQHGSVIKGKESINEVGRQMLTLDDVGIDAVLGPDNG